MKKLNLTDKRNPDYFYSEAIKTLRTNIQLSGQSIKTILVTSCYPNEGKSDVVLSLARELGSIGKKVLLLDADIRKTAYAGRLGVEEEVKGLSQLLSGSVVYLIFCWLAGFFYGSIIDNRRCGFILWKLCTVFIGF